MWRFIKNVEPPAKKQRQTAETKQVVRKSYEEEKRDRSYQPKWENEFSWLSYEPDHKSMHCKVCREIFGTRNEAKSVIPEHFEKYSTTSFVTGSKIMKHHNLVEHQKSKSHKIAVEKHDARTRMPGTSIAEKAVQNLNASVFEKLTKLFRNAHAIAKMSKPISLCG